MKPINYSNPTLGISTDFMGVDNYQDNDKDNVSLGLRITIGMTIMIRIMLTIRGENK